MTLLTLFEQQVEKAPDAIAVVYQENQLTYSELNQRANQIANVLVARGIGPEAVVGIAMERCAEMLIAMLAAWKAGGVYLPLDPAYPAERLAFMMEDSGVTFVLSKARPPEGLQ